MHDALSCNNSPCLSCYRPPTTTPMQSLIAAHAHICMKTQRQARRPRVTFVTLSLPPLGVSLATRVTNRDQTGRALDMPTAETRFRRGILSVWWVIHACFVPELRGDCTRLMSCCLLSLVENSLFMLISVVAAAAEV